MEMVVWQHEGQMVGNTLLAMTGEALYEFVRTGNSSRKKIGDVAEALAKGWPPDFSRPSHVVPLVAIRRIEVSPDRPIVKFHYDDGKPRTFEYRVGDRVVAAEIARAVVDRAGLSPVERREDLSVMEVLDAPFLLIALVAGSIFLALIVMWAMGQGSPNARYVPTEPKEGSRRRWYHRLEFLMPLCLYLGPLILIGLLFAAGWVPARVWQIVGVVVFGSLTLWTAWRIVHRPQKLVWGGPIKA